MKIHPVGAEYFLWGQADRKDEAVSGYSQFCEHDQKGTSDKGKWFPIFWEPLPVYKYWLGFLVPMIGQKQELYTG